MEAAIAYYACGLETATIARVKAQPSTSVPCFSGKTVRQRVDNLPNEMPRDASEAFGRMFLEHVLPELLRPASPVIAGGTIAEGGSLTERFRYLEDYAAHGEVREVLA